MSSKVHEPRNTAGMPPEVPSNLMKFKGSAGRPAPTLADAKGLCQGSVLVAMGSPTAAEGRQQLTPRARCPNRHQHTARRIFGSDLGLPWLLAPTMTSHGHPAEVPPLITTLLHTHLLQAQSLVANVTHVMDELEGGCELLFCSVKGIAKRLFPGKYSGTLAISQQAQCLSGDVPEQGHPEQAVRGHAEDLQGGHAPLQAKASVAFSWATFSQVAENQNRQ
ncbi:uncharacterized protein LOC118169778 [Oxyura jamaicensis]|uniref:uncharacterized protein LOC118169778 n=1 Tax=Oxyura jamaicensis TaxID=8884 RepID=UPI0015A5D36D|nr:uncharacterized protein LOC118169778 [Oxyura jamaicensis]